MPKLLALVYGKGIGVPSLLSCYLNLFKFVSVRQLVMGAGINGGLKGRREEDLPGPLPRYRGGGGEEGGVKSR